MRKFSPLKKHSTDKNDRVMPQPTKKPRKKPMDYAGPLSDFSHGLVGCLLWEYHRTLFLWEKGENIYQSLLGHGFGTCGEKMSITPCFNTSNGAFWSIPLLPTRPDLPRVAVKQYVRLHYLSNLAFQHPWFKPIGLQVVGHSGELSLQEATLEYWVS